MNLRGASKTKPPNKAPSNAPHLTYGRRSRAPSMMCCGGAFWLSLTQPISAVHLQNISSPAKSFDARWFRMRDQESRSVIALVTLPMTRGRECISQRTHLTTSLHIIGRHRGAGTGGGTGSVCCVVTGGGGVGTGGGGAAGTGMGGCAAGGSPVGGCAATATGMGGGAAGGSPVGSGAATGTGMGGGAAGGSPVGGGAVDGVTSSGKKTSDVFFPSLPVDRYEQAASCVIYHWYRTFAMANASGLHSRPPPTYKTGARLACSTKALLDGVAHLLDQMRCIGNHDDGAFGVGRAAETA